MCKEAGIQGKKANHSLRATGASALFNAGVPEKLIRDVTGHRSKALELYECPSLDQLKAVSRVLLHGRSFEKENFNPKPPSILSCNKHNNPDVFGSLFSGLSNCTVTISPQNLIDIVGTSGSSSEVSSALNGISLEQILED